MNITLRHVLMGALAVGFTPILSASSCASFEPEPEYAADYCDELLPEAEQQIEQSYEQQGGDADRVSASVTGPFGESVEMEIVAESGGSISTQEDTTVQTGLSDIVLNCGTDPFDNRTCGAQLYLDGELIARGHPDTTGQMAMRCLPAGQRELRIVAYPGGQEIFRDVITIESDVEYMAHIEEDGIDANFEFYGQSDLSLGFATPGEGGGDSVHVDAQASAPSDGGPATDDRHPAAGQQPMSSLNFDDLRRRLEDADFSSDEVALIEDAMGANYFSAEQAEILVGSLSSSSDQEDIAIQIYDRVVNPERFYIVVDVIDSSISRDNVRDELDL